MPQSESTILYATMSDGVKLAMRVYGPIAEKRPILFAASPYRFDNDDLPETTTFLWKETGPIDWYVARGYSYVHLDVRGTGRSEGEYQFWVVERDVTCMNSSSGSLNSLGVRERLAA